MKAAVFRGLGNPLAIETVVDPEIRNGEVLLKVAYCGICGSDLHATAEGVFVVPDGTVLGHEFSGEVVKSADLAWAKGDRLTSVPVNACADETCQRLGACKNDLGILCPNNRITGLAVDVPGAYAEYVKVGARQALRLPDGVSYQEGALVEPLAVGLHAVRKAKLGVGARILIIGAGPIGLSVAAFARLAGAREVVVSEMNATRREKSMAMGATAVIDPASENTGEAFARIAGCPPDTIFECVGVRGLIQQCIDLSRPRGLLVVVGVCMMEDTVVPISAILKELNIQFVLGYLSEDFEIVLDAIAKKTINAMPMVSDIVGFDELPAAFETLRRPKDQIKVLIRPGA
jgi:(R,R)-butanediol dehydrogenase/meso-butanediol dehydrogenase/diacetyl reductase